jgi:hypothetical protein
MHSEIENLINMALADGEVTDKERGIILRKAESLGIDKDEVEMILDGKIALYNKQANTLVTQKNNKEGDIKKCPACGAIVKSFNTKCVDCSHEFRGIVAANSVKELYKALSSIEIEERNRIKQKVGFFEGGQAMADYNLEIAIANRISTTISSFAVPNSKEDILEFLSLALPQSKVKIFKIFGMTAYGDKPKEAIKNAWISKCEQVIMKAKFSMKDDKKTLDEIEYYAKQLNLK